MGQHGKHGSLVILRNTLTRAAAAPAALVFSTSFAAANCRLDVIQAIDVSNSVDKNEDILQRNGLANALITPEIRQTVFATNDLALTAFERAPPRIAHTSDMAGDGKNNDGYDPSQAYASSKFDGITINELVIHVINLGVDNGVIPYYKSQVIRGSGAFAQVAERLEGDEPAMHHKLERELAPAMMSAIPSMSDTNG